MAITHDTACKGKSLVKQEPPRVRLLSADELAVLRRGMTDAARWMRAELARRRSQEGRA